MTRTTTHVLMVIDASGSMSGLADDVIGGFNTYIEKLRSSADEDNVDYRVSVTTFNTRARALTESMPIAQVPVLTRANYRPGGFTALLDALGQTMDGFDAARPELGDGERVILSVQTDGHENASKEYVGADIKTKISRWQEQGRACLFVGAGPDTWEQAAGYGFDKGSTVTVLNTSGATRSTYEGLVTGTRSYSRGGTAKSAATDVANATGGQTRA